MNGLGEGIAFAALCAGTAWLEITGNDVGALWMLVGVWAICTDWGQK